MALKIPQAAQLAQLAAPPCGDWCCRPRPSPLSAAAALWQGGSSASAIWCMVCAGAAACGSIAAAAAPWKGTASRRSQTVSKRKRFFTKIF
jgi:hypothetical protein